MEEKHRSILDNNTVEIRRELDPDRVLSYFIQEGAMTDEDVAAIRAETTRHRKVDRFLDVLKRSNKRAFDIFVEALERTQEHLACLLLRSELNRVKGDLDKSLHDLGKSRNEVKMLQRDLNKEN